MSLQIGWKYLPFQEVEIKSGSFCASLNGLRIVQLSDLHLTKNVDIAYLKTVVKKINEIKPDLVLFTGDIIQTSALHLREHLRTFRELKSNSYYVTGNHDLFYGTKHLQEIMAENGIVCLDNKIASVDVKGSVLQLIGLSDRYSFVRGIKRPIEELFSKLNPDLSTILLAHQPKDIEHVGNYRVDIQLSGHTHGGQIYPFNIIVKYFQPYIAGLYKYKNTLLYVSRGLGYWGLRVRYKAPSEITIFTIN